MDSDKRLWLSVLGLIAGCGAVLVTVVSLGAGEAPLKSATVDTPIVPTSDDVEEDASRRTAGTRAIETYEVFASKDPFAPLVSGLPTAAGEGGAVTSEGSEGVMKTFESTGTGRSQTSVRLVDVYRSNGARIDIEVDKVLFTVAEGEIFAEHFMLLTASNDCATLLYGDDEFTICEGESVLK